MRIEFENPIYLYLLLSIPLLIISHFYVLKYSKRKGLLFANIEAIRRVAKDVKLSNHYPVLVLRVIILLLLVLSASGTTLWYFGHTNDFSFVLAIDASASMLANDFAPSRFEAAKESAKLFVDIINSSTEIGVVSFSGIGYVERQLDLNKIKVKEAIDAIDIKNTHGTALSDAIVVSSQLLSASEKPKAVILLTDGADTVAPNQIYKVIEYARDQHIVVHTIAMATEEGGTIKNLENKDVLFKLDSRAIQELSNRTGGKYVEAENAQDLVDAYQDIGANVQEGEIPVALSYLFLVIGLLLLFIEWGLINSKYKIFP